MLPGLRCLHQAREIGHDLLRVCASVADLVHLGDDAVGVDEERHPLGEVRVLLVGRSLDAVDPAHRPVDVAQQREPEAVLLGEDLVVSRGVEAGAEDTGPGGSDLGASVTEALSLARSAAGRRLREPPQHDPRPAQVGQLHGAALLVGEREVGCGGTGLDHGGAA